MKSTKVILRFAVVVAVVMLTFSCKKSDNNPNQNEADSFKKDALVESTFNEVAEIADQAWNSVAYQLKSTEGGNFIFSPCATITVDTVSMPHVMTIDFGPENCLCHDGKYRRGQIIVTFTGRYREPGTVKTRTFNEYYVNDNHVEGQSVVSNMGFNDDGFIYFTIAVEGTITFANGEGTWTWMSNHTKTWIEGYETFSWLDDVYLIEGNSSSTFLDGGTVSRQIILPLRRELTCHHFVSGSIEITRENKPTRLLDFGDGTCDDIATVTINGETHIIKLK